MQIIVQFKAISLRMGGPCLLITMMISFMRESNVVLMLA